MGQSVAPVLSAPTIEEWTHKITSVWQPQRILEIRQRGNTGLLFIAELAPGITLHLGVQAPGVDFCTIWKGNLYVLWDSLVGFCAMFPPLPVPPEHEAFEIEMKALIRRNCFLLGSKVEATDEEKRQWQQCPDGPPSLDGQTTRGNTH